MTIGDIDLGAMPVLLAPMEDVTDASFRGICREQGADMTYTEFIPAEGLIRDARKAYAKLKTSDSEAPIGIQIYAVVGGVDVGIAQRQHAGILRLPVHDALAELCRRDCRRTRL